ncbi:ABC transporter ATP-binding protein [Klenkia terrae]|uniref:ABC transporter ATP-binding protein n=1 Tax=Klenkia terrae TaxID=1052259 RepID=A0ABU8E755_9ACTN|nr:ABC transporter ATP-binding protein [Klenkia terrae]SSC23460.1 ABC transporter with ATPase domain [Klenkia terrae]
MTAPLLEVSGLRVRLPSRTGAMLPAVDGVDLTVHAGEVLGVAGESGSGKTMTALATLGLLPHGARTDGSIRLAGRELLTLSDKQLRSVRGREVAMVAQDPRTALHPMLSIERQLTEHLRHHHGVGRKAARDEAADLLDQVRIPDPRAALARYPHEFSGGMRQRIAIASALAARPSLLIADEPTTALDVTVQAGILRLLDRLRRERGLAVLIITHDLGVLSSIADRLVVMYAGRVVESGTTADVLASARHPYTHGLLDALPEGGSAAMRPIPGSPPALGAVPSGCPFHPRCASARDTCAADVPALLQIAPGRLSACPVDPYAPVREVVS